MKDKLLKDNDVITLVNSLLTILPQDNHHIYMYIAATVLSADSRPPVTVRETAPLCGETAQLHVISCIMAGQLFQEAFLGQCSACAALFKVAQYQSSTSGLPFANVFTPWKH